MKRRHSSVFPTLTALTPALVAALFVLAPAREARASSGKAIGVDLDYTHGISEPGVSSGRGFNVRLGYKLDLLVLQLTPEVGGAYHSFSGSGDVSLSQAIAGARLSFGKVLEPGLYAHVGYGHLGYAGGSRSGVTGDAGLTLDFTLLPLLDIGVHGGYNGVTSGDSQPAFDSYVLGLHAALVF